MALPIGVTSTTGNLYESVSPSFLNWKFIPPKLHFYWLMGQAAPAAFNQVVEYPAYDGLPSYLSHTDWRFECVMEHSGSIPFCTVQGAFTYTGGLGVAFINAGSFYRKTLSLSFVNLNLLSTGLYNIAGKMKITAVSPLTNLRETIHEKELSMEFIVSSGTFPLGAPFTAEYEGKEFVFGTGTAVVAPLMLSYAA